MALYLSILGLLFVGWLLVFVQKSKLSRLQAELQQLQEQLVRHGNNDDQWSGQAATTAQNLIVLRLDLQRMISVDDVEGEDSQHLLDRIDQLLADHLRKTGLEPNGKSWVERRDSGWRMLIAHGYIPHGSAPWQSPPETKSQALEVKDAEREPAISVRKETNEADEKAQVSAQAESSTEKEPVLPLPPAVARPVDRPTAHATVTQPTTKHSVDRPRKTIADTRNHAWQVAEPSAMERALRTVSGWPRAMLPFLVQNIGWFIGAFCFIAGSVFLVSYTSGFAKALTVTAALLTYTGFLIWAGYQLRRKRPEVKAASNVLMIMGMLLVPLNFSASARLMLNAADSWLPWIVALLSTAFMLGVFYYISRLVTGVVDHVL